MSFKEFFAQTVYRLRLASSKHSVLHAFGAENRAYFGAKSTQRFMLSTAQIHFQLTAHFM